MILKGKEEVKLVQSDTIETMPDGSDDETEDENNEGKRIGEVGENTEFGEECVHGGYFNLVMRPE